jgi:hypothetical protein
MVGRRAQLRLGILVEAGGAGAGQSAGCWQGDRSGMWAESENEADAGSRRLNVRNL